MGVSKGYQPNVFRAISGSLFSTAGNWSRGYVPTGSDVATIADNCVIDVSRTIGSLVVRAPFTASVNTGLTLLVKDIIDVKGHLSCSGNPNIISEARKNNINSFSAASSSFFYSGSNQNVPGGPYFDLTIYGTGVKTVTANTIVNRSLTVGTGAGIRGFLELGSYDLSVFGNTVVGANGDGVLSKSKFGNLLFVGSFANGNRDAAIRFSDGNPNVEFRSGIITTNSNPTSNTIQSGIGTWTFTSPTQTLQGWASFAPLNLDANIIISSSAVLNVFGGYNISNPINGAGPSSRLVMLANNLLTFTTAKALVNSMTTGSIDFTSSYNIIGIGGNYSATIPARFNAFRDLSISGTGIKTLGTSSFISGSLTNNTNGTLELGNSDLFVSGTTNVGDGNTNVFRKSGSGSITFVGEVVRLGWNSGVGMFDLVGNPNVECRGGIRTLGANTSTFKSGFGTWSFAVNSQRVYLDNSAVPSTLTFSGSVLIKDGINLSIGQNVGMGFVVMKDINGTTSTAKLTNSGSLYFVSSSQSMTTGTLDLSFPGNLIGWVSNDNHPLYYSTYNTLYIAGFGTKYATSSLYMSSSLTLATGSLDLGVYNMFVSGTSNLGRGTLIKTSSGDIIFNGQINTFITAGGGTPTMNISASYIEVRNGIILDYSPNVLSTQTFYFTTNNQTITGSNAATNPQLNNTNFIISGAINLTISPALSLTFTGYMDGTDPNSKLTIGRGPVPNSPGGGIVYYSSPIMPMATSGTLDASSSLNVFVYNGGAQDIRGGIYRNLTFSGGAKTLRGNVSVLNTLNTGSVTVNLNGFTLTNP